MPLEGEYGPSTSEWARSQAEAYEASGGKDAATLGDSSMAIIVLTTVGAKSGLLRKTALMRVTDGTNYAVVASRGGAPEHPQWYWNLLANPLVELQDRESKRDYLARELAGEERSLWWDRSVEAYPPYAEYQEKTARTIPVFVLEPVEG
ncbi:MAG TPA: nitroreductase family deazaflavin-dependent oxidoreductase [Microbacteriaceae bacterium]|nr:nitroreductase family deazaflavin-dependent oxidoreductase [Microbacteriaceae bacterium]